MSHRLPASALALLLSLGFLGSLLFHVPAAAAFGEKVFEANPVIANADFDVFQGQSVAQSFVATATYRLLNVTLRLRNTGALTDPINVSVHADASYQPAATALDESQIVSGGATTLVSVPFPATPVLAQGLRYWIVTSHPGLLSDSYRWFHGSADTYPAGGAAYNFNVGGPWVNVTPRTDMYFVTYGREDDANVTMDLSVSPVEAAWKDPITFSLTYSNRGTQAARRVWIDLTLAPGLTYVSDDAIDSLTPFPSFTFDDVSNGVHAFSVVARIGTDPAPGMALVSVASFLYRNATGVPRPGGSSEATVVVGLATDSLYLVDGPSYGLTPDTPTGDLTDQRNVTLRRSVTIADFDLTVPFARPFRAVRGDAFLFVDSERGTSESLDVNLTLYEGGSGSVVAYAQTRLQTNNVADYEVFHLSFPAFDHTFPQGQGVRLRIRNMGSSTDHALLAFNSTFAPSRIDMRTSTHARIDAIELHDASGPATAWTSRDAIVVRANISDPLGPDRILGARLNATDPAGTGIASDAAMILRSTDASAIAAWSVYEYRIDPPLQDGSYGFEVTARGVAGANQVALSVAEVLSPALDLVVLVTDSNVATGERFFYRVFFNNTGSAGTTRVWLNASFGSELALLGSSDPLAMSGPSNWTWPSVGVGSHAVDIEVLVVGAQPVPFIRTSFLLDVTDSKGHAWPSDTVITDVAMNGPVIAFSQSPSRATVHANESVAFTFVLDNTGDPAQTVWLNNTLPVGLEYVSNDAVTLGGVTSFSGGAIRFVFTNLPAATTWSFVLVARGSVGNAPATTLVNRADLNYTNLNGSLMPRALASASVESVAPWITGDIGVTPSNATPGDVARIQIDLADIGNEPAPNAWLNVTLDPSLRFLEASRPATVSGTVVRFTLVDVGIGSHSTTLNASIEVTVPDGRDLGVTARVEYEDGIANPMTPGSFGPVVVRARAPRLTVSATPSNVTVEAGGTFTLTIRHANAGSGTAGDVWLNISLPAPFVYVSDTSDGELTREVYSLVSWHWTGYAPGSRTFDLVLEIRPTTDDGTAEDFLLETEYTDANGNWHTGMSATAAVAFVAPDVSLDLSIDRTEASPGGILTYTLRLRNLGSTPAKQLWLLDAVDPRFEVVTYDATVPMVAGTELNWSFPDLDPGEIETVTLVLRVRESTAAGTPLANVFEAIYTNSQGEVIGYRRSTPVTITVAGLIVPTSVVITAGGSAAGLAGLIFVLRRRGTEIEEVFLVYQDGVLIYHLSRSLVQDRDEDVLSGMLTAVQEFVRDAFRYGEHRQLHQLDFGDYRILIERGRAVYLAVVYSGHESTAVRRKVRTVLDRIEHAYADVLKAWNGDMDQVVGARDIIRDHLLKGGQRAKAQRT